MAKGEYYSPFGSLLRAYRERLGGKRASQEWLAHLLGYTKGIISRWETGEPSVSLPRREVIVKIGRFYSLTSDEVDALLTAVRGDYRARPARVAAYVPLTPKEALESRPFYGPEIGSIRVWEEALRSAKQAYLDGELLASRHLAEALMDHIQLATSEEAWANDLWKAADFQELNKLWLLGWHQFYLAIGLLEEVQRGQQIIAPYAEQAWQRVATVTDPTLQALVYHVEGERYRKREDFKTAVAFHKKVLRLIPPNNGISWLVAHAQRYLILDLPYTVQSHELADQVQQGYRLVESISPGDVHTRSMLLEAIGRSFGVRGDAQSWQALEDAEKEAKGRDRIGHVTSLYSSMVALINNPHRSDVDKDHLRAIGEKALLLAQAYGWGRRIEQIRATAQAGGVTLE